MCVSVRVCAQCQQDVYAENTLQTLMKEIEEDPSTWKDIPCQNI